MVVGVTGHQDIPPAATKFVKDRIAILLCKVSGKITAVSSLASGADQLFAKIALGLGAELHVIVPCDKYESTFSNERTLNQYRKLLRDAGKVEVLKHKGPSMSAFLDAGRHVVDISQLVIAVWDGLKSRGKGGTADIVRYARQRDKEVVVIWPTGVARIKQTRPASVR